MKALFCVLALALSGCAPAVAPRAIDPRTDACHQCRMLVSDPRLAAEVTAPGEEPIFFDDLGCLREFAATTSRSDAAIVVVADHRTGEWVPAEAAVYTRTASPASGMGSGLLAHRDAASRDADEAAAGGVQVNVAAVLGQWHPRTGSE
jgi:copper chaperone NosL